MVAPGDRARLASSEYWDGIDTDDPSHFDVPYVPAARVTAHEQKAAALVLASCLNEVISNDFVEQELRAGEEFDPTETELEDGTVLIIDSEHLFRWSYPPGSDHEWEEPNQALDTPPISNDFVSMWRGRQPYNTSTDQHFGDERVAFPEDKMVYGRVLSWGVLLTRRDAQRDRFLATWALAAPHATPRGVAVPLSPDMEMFRTAERLPMKVGQAIPNPDTVAPTFGIRSVERVRKLKIVHAATASYEPAEERSRLFRRSKATNEQEAFAPEPEPSTA